MLKTLITAIPLGVLLVTATEASKGEIKHHHHHPQKAHHHLHETHAKHSSYPSFKSEGEPKSQHWPYYNYPNPFDDDEVVECKGQRLSMPDPTYLCDPDGVLTPGAADNLEKHLAAFRVNNVHRCPGNDKAEKKLVVAVATTIARSHTQRKDTAAKKFAQKLLGRYRHGNRDCADGAVLVYVVEDQAAGVAWEPGLDDKLDDKALSGTLEQLESALGYAVKKKEISSYALSKAVDGISDTMNRLSPDILYLLFISVGLIVIIGFGCIVWHSYFGKKDADLARHYDAPSDANTA